MIGLHKSICPICNYKYKEFAKEGWRYCKCKEEEE